jgi:hypothetical protein
VDRDDPVEIGIFKAVGAKPLFAKGEMAISSLAREAANWDASSGAQFCSEW